MAPMVAGLEQADRVAIRVAQAGLAPQPWLVGRRRSEYDPLRLQSCKDGFSIRAWVSVPAFEFDQRLSW
jgi:hypothetical protein